MTDRPNDTTGIGRLEDLARLANDRFVPMSDMEHAAGFEAAAARVPPRASARTARRIAWAACFVAAAAVFALVARFGSHERTSPALSLTIVGAELQKQYVRAAAGARPSLHFSDGTRVALEERTSLRIASVDSRGAHFALEHGRVRAEVVHRDTSAWTFDAGPFAVEVTGTTFSVDWGALDGRLDVRLEQGLLRIHTPFSRDPIALHGGQRLLATLSDERVVISSLHESTATEAPNPPPAAGSPAPAAPAAHAKPRASAAASSGPTWAESFAAGDFKTILDDAQQHGLDATLAERGAEDLQLLADAARYSGQAATARRALLAQRARFASSSRAKDAAFLLGRMQEPSDPEGALVWYDRYLGEARRGTFASEALGRKMLVVQHLRGNETARPVAETYLERFPDGPHATSAKAIVAAP